jgi:mannose-6-phosphate isomerase-like protein (cupin superfamily)
MPSHFDDRSPSDDYRPRRVVTGHDSSGRSVILSDGPSPVVRTLPDDGVTFAEIWQTEAVPALLTAREALEPTDRSHSIPPPPGGTRIRLNEFQPGFLDSRGLQSPIHRTETVDYGIVLEGEITLILDDVETALRAGDVVVQRGTDHAWANRGSVPCRIAFILIDGTFAPELLDALPADTKDTMMRHAG